ncbi:MAG: nucleotide sugar dehydrogenase [Acidimicrobiia bacterium]
MSAEAEFIERVARRDVVVGVVGQGYVGLPLAVAFAQAGFRAVGFDVAVERIAALGQGHSHIEDIPDAVLGEVVAAGRYRATAEVADLAAADAVFISVPTPFDEHKVPDLSYVRAAAESVARALHPGMLVVLQSTTYPGTTAEVVQPILEQTGLKVGEDVFLAFSPERVDPGNTRWNVRNTPKVVGGTTPACSAMAAALLDAVLVEPGGVTVLSSPDAAEMTKLLENTYRAVNIALVNELAMLCNEMGIDVWEVIAGAATKPFGFQPFQPGIGPGGHCIPVDPYYLSWRARAFDFQTKFIELAADTNLRMAQHVRTRVAAFLNDRGRSLRGTEVLVLGVAFKPNVSDVRNSRALRVVELLEEAGAVVRYSDPWVPSVVIDGIERKSTELTPEVLEGTDLVLVLVGHDEWPVERLRGLTTPVFDAVNALGPPGRPDHERL